MKRVQLLKLGLTLLLICSFLPIKAYSAVVDEAVNLASLIKSTNENLKKESMAALKADTLGQIGRAYTYLGDKVIKDVIAKTPAALAKADKYNDALIRIEKLMKTASRYDSKLQNMQKSFVNKSVQNIDDLAKVAKYGKGLKAVGTAMGGAASVYSIYSTISDYNEKTNNDTATALDALQASSEILTAVTTAIPGVGTVVGVVDLAKDASVYAIDKGLDKGRAQSIAEANTIINTYNNHWGYARNEVLESARSGSPMDETQVLKTLKKYGDQLNNELLELEGKIGNRIADDDVSVKALKSAFEVVEQIKSFTVDDSIIKSWAKKGIMIKLKTELENLNEAAADYVNDLNEISEVVQEVKEATLATAEFSNTLASVERAITAKQTQAEEVREKNLKLALKYEELLKSGKGDTEEAKTVAAELNRTGEEYRQLRSEILEADPDYQASVYATSGTVYNNYKTSAEAIIKDKKEYVQSLSKEQMALQKEQAGLNSDLRDAKFKQSQLSRELSMLQGSSGNIQSQIDAINEQLAEYEGSSTGLDKVEIVDKLKSVLEGFVYARYLNEKYNGDFNKLSYSEKFKLRKYSSIIYGNTYRTNYLFTNGDKHVDSAKDAYLQAKDYEANNQEVYGKIAELRRQRDLLEAELQSDKSDISDIEASLYNLSQTISQINEMRSDNAVTYESNREKLSELISEVNDFQKEQYAVAEYAAYISDNIDASGETDDIVDDSEEIHGVSGEDNDDNSDETEEPSQPADSSDRKYRGNMAASFASGGSHSAAIKGDEITVEPYVGMAINPLGSSGVYAGDFEIATIENTDELGEYSYMSWGTWNATNPPQTYTESNGNVNEFANGYWVMGAISRDIPAQGSATYRGVLEGDYNSNGILEAGVMSGSIDMTANFANSQLTGDINIKRSGVDWQNSDLQNGTINNQYGYFSADLSGDGTGNINGRFFGENAQIPVEAGGSWYYRKSDNSNATGIFRAKKQ